MSLDLENAVTENADAVWEVPFTGYENITVIKQGVSGIVLRATDTRFSREAVLKLITPDLQNHPTAAERFFNEARTTARLRHPHLARGIDCGRGGQYFFYAMEFIRGETVQEKLARLQTHKLKEAETLRLMQQASDALNYMFNHGLLHYDLKPSNLLIEHTGKLKITDFGVAKDLAFPNWEAWTLANAPYVSPEQARGEMTLDVRSALYTLGCTWYEMLIGQPPFFADSPSVILLDHLEKTPPLPQEIDSRISPATGQLIAWLLNKDREKRPRNPQQFLAKLSTHPIIKTFDGEYY